MLIDAVNHRHVRWPHHLGNTCRDVEKVVVSLLPHSPQTDDAHEAFSLFSYVFRSCHMMLVVRRRLTGYDIRGRGRRPYRRRLDVGGRWHSGDAPAAVRPAGRAQRGRRVPRDAVADSRPYATHEARTAAPVYESRRHSGALRRLRHRNDAGKKTTLASRVADGGETLILRLRNDAGLHIDVHPIVRCLVARLFGSFAVVDTLSVVLPIAFRPQSAFSEIICASASIFTESTWSGST